MREDWRIGKYPDLNVSNEMIVRRRNMEVKV